MTRSRLRRPTSKSIATVLRPSCARPVARLALVVVFPTPPLPDVTTTTLDTRSLLWNFAFHSTVVPPTCQIFCHLLVRPLPSFLPPLPLAGVGRGEGPPSESEPCGTRRARAQAASWQT